MAWPKWFKFGYDAVATDGRRKASAVSYGSEDRELRDRKREIMSSANRDLTRNFTVAGWAIRKHLDYVSTFTFQSRSGNRDFDRELESFVRWYSKPENCDIAGRHSLPRLVRLGEERRTVDGDVLVNFLKDGRTQWIESDRVLSSMNSIPPGTIRDKERLVNGVIVDDYGAALAYIVGKRNESVVEFDAILSAAYARLHGYYARFDQVRGVSPLAPAINTFKDLYEGYTYALAKLKVSQLFALAFYRDGADPMGDSVQDGVDANGDAKYSVDFSKGPAMLDLDPGDRAEFLESKNPSSEFQSFTQQITGLALKALDIPYSFYDEAHTNYAGARQALLQYEQSAEIKRCDNRNLLDWITNLRLRKAVQDGDITIPQGYQISSANWEWVADVLPWIDPLKEVTAVKEEIKAGLTSPQRALRSGSADVEDIIDEIAAAQDYARSKGVVLDFDTTAEAKAMNIQGIQNGNQSNPN